MEESEADADLVVDFGRGAAGAGELSGGGTDEDDKFTQGVEDKDDTFTQDWLRPNGDG